MSYERSKVDFSDEEHSQAQRIDGNLEVIIENLKDGFQVNDLMALGPSGFDLYRVSAEILKKFQEENARKPTVAELAEILATRLLMLARDNDWLGVGA
jgi:hypothetical protein